MCILSGSFIVRCVVWDSRSGFGCRSIGGGVGCFMLKVSLLGFGGLDCDCDREWGFVVVVLLGVRVVLFEVRGGVFCYFWVVELLGEVVGEDGDFID